MGRLGLLAREAERAVPEIAALPGLRCEGIYSHFPVAYRSGSDYTNAQIEAFLDLLRRLEARGLTFPLRHMANSDAINNFPRAFRAPFNAVRTGINLHGSFDIEGRRALDLRPVLTLKTRLAAVRRLPAGTHVGYGCTYRLPCEMLVGVVSAGYADGLPLALSNRGHVLIRGRPCHVLGRVSMDYTTVALDQVPDAQWGDEVVCLGGEGPAAVSVEDWAALKGTHPYEVICSFGSRVARCCLDG
jgi:alanine racemase